jgi:hypothetical protein
MAELAVETGIPVNCWRDEDDATLATVLDVLEQRAKEMRRGR